MLTVIGLWLTRWKTYIIIAGIVFAAICVGILYIFHKGKSAGVASVERKLREAYDNAQKERRKINEKLRGASDSDLDSELRK